MAKDDFKNSTTFEHPSVCRCARCYDPVLMRTKNPYIPEEYVQRLESEEQRKAESAKRKGKPLFSGCLMYFPDALLAVAEHSKKANDKHNPGEPLHWSKDKSKDHADCIARHLVDIGPNWDDTDPEFDSLHATALAWRSLALLQTVLERKKGK
jgi:hypothetical protein